MTVGNGRVVIVTVITAAALALALRKRGVAMNDHDLEKGDRIGTGHRQGGRGLTEIGHPRGRDHLNHDDTEIDTTAGVEYLSLTL